MLFLHSHLLFGISPTGFHFNNRNKAYLWQKNVLWIVNNNKTHYDLFHDRLPWAHRIIRKAYPFLSLMFFLCESLFFFLYTHPFLPINENNNSSGLSSSAVVVYLGSFTEFENNLMLHMRIIVTAPNFNLLFIFNFPSSKIVHCRKKKKTRLTFHTQNNPIWVTK